MVLYLFLDFFGDSIHSMNAGVVFDEFFSGKWLWMFMIDSVRMLAALLIMLMGSELS